MSPVRSISIDPLIKDYFNYTFDPSSLLDAAKADTHVAGCLPTDCSLAYIV